MLEQMSALEIALITVILVLAGMTKGVLGVGLPLIAVPLLSQIVPVPLAIMTLSISQVLSNGYQAFQGRSLRAVLRRFWTLFLPLVAALFAGVRLLIDLDARMLGFILGTLLLVFTALSRFPRLLRISRSQERLANPLVGACAGLVGGISSFSGPVVLMYFMALGLEQEFFISAVSIAFLLGALPLVISLTLYGAMGRDEFILSGLSAIPVFGGLLVGQVIRTHMPQELFRKGLLVILLASGASLVLRAMLA
ncbi:MAG: sulfite exporter TauE/SafE family protein [Alphaproteobacteria bacterium]